MLTDKQIEREKVFCYDWYVTRKMDKTPTYADAIVWADKTMIEKVCKCYCDDICDTGRCGMCFHKYDGEYQVKNTFQYNECNELKFLRKAMEE